MNRHQEISDNLSEVQKRIANAAHEVGRDPESIALIAVTKNFPASDANILYSLGVRNFGENRDDEGASKSMELPSDAIWHFQGAFQGRKIKSLVRWADVVHSLGSIDHARKFRVSEQCDELQFFVQVNLEPERTDRGGIPAEFIPQFLEDLEQQTQLIPSGLMLVAPLGMDPAKAFKEVAQLRDTLMPEHPALQKLSMGMSGDFEDAIRLGATHIRIGSSILGSRLAPA